jgi:cell division protein FtsQ
MLLAAGMLGAVIAANVWKTDLQIAGVEVQGNRIVSAEEILRRANIARGARLFEVDLFAVKRRVEENAFVRTAEVGREVPGRIVITVEERSPVAVIAASPMLYIDADGMLLPAAASPLLVDLPVLTGDLPRRALVPGRQTFNPDIREALAIVTTAARVEVGLAHLLSEVHLKRDGDFVLYTAEAGVPVLFGRGDVARKLVNFDVFWHDYVQREGPAELGSVDLRFNDQVVVRWRHGRPTGGRTDADGRTEGAGGQRSPT